MANIVHPYGGTQDFILQGASGTQGGNVFTSFSDLVKVLSTVDSGAWKRILVDDRFDIPEIPGEVFQLPPFTVLTAVGPKDGGTPRTFCSILDGCQLLGLRFITGPIYVDFQGVTTPLVPASDFTDSPQRVVIGGVGVEEGSRTQLDSSGAPLFDFGDDCFPQIEWRGKTGVNGNPLFRLGTAGAGEVLCRVLAGGQIGNNSFDGPAGSTVSLTLDPGGLMTDDPIGAFGGTFNINCRGPGSTYSFFNVSVAATVGTHYLSQGSGPDIAPTGTRRGRFPRAGVVKNLSAHHNSAPGNANMVDYEIEIETAGTGITVSLVANDFGGAENVDGYFLVAAGDRYAVTATKAVSIGDGGVNVYVSFDYFPVIELG